VTQIIFKQRNNVKKTVIIENGMSLMHCAIENNITDIKAICGGNCNCATCHIVIEPNYRNVVTSLSSVEQQILNKLRNKQDGSRLACQIIVNKELEGMRVIIK